MKFLGDTAAFAGEMFMLRSSIERNPLAAIKPVSLGAIFSRSFGF
jgi:hypothetical protein